MCALIYVKISNGKTHANVETFMGAFQTFGTFLNEQYLKHLIVCDVQGRHLTKCQIRLIIAEKFNPTLIFVILLNIIICLCWSLCEQYRALYYFGDMIVEYLKK